MIDQAIHAVQIDHRIQEPVYNRTSALIARVSNDAYGSAPYDLIIYMTAATGVFCPFGQQLLREHSISA